MPLKKTALIGAHISIAGGFELAIERAESIGATAIQIFTKSSRTWFEKPISQQSAQLFKDALKKSSVQIVVAHSAYLINIGSPNKKTEAGSCNSLLNELQRCEALGLPFLVLHPGSHLGSGEEPCIERIAKNLDLVLAQHTGSTKILLETMAGQGSNIGSTFEQLSYIRDLAKEKRRIQFCLDTCHIFAAGYDLRSTTSYKEVMKQFDRIIGFDLLKIIHLNDSQEPFDSHKDRHADIGKGHIPLTVFKELMNDSRLQDVPKILETPAEGGLEDYRHQIDILRRMIV